MHNRSPFSQQFTVLPFLPPAGRTTSHTTASRGPEDGDRQQSGLDLASLQALVHHCFVQGLALSSKKAYLTAQCRFHSFCSSTAKPPLSASEDTLQMFVGRLAKEGLSHQTIRVYLSGIRSMHVCWLPQGICKTDDSQNRACFKRHQEGSC